MAGSNSIKATKRLALADALSQLCSGSNWIVAGGLGRVDSWDSQG